MSQAEHYLQQELYEQIKSHSDIFEFIQKSAIDGLWYWDLEQPQHEWMSPDFWITLGYNPADMPHRADAWQNIIFPEDLKSASERLSQHLADPNIPYDQVVRYRHKKGHTVWVRCRGIAIRNEKGEPTRMLGAHVDLTSLKEKEGELQIMVQELDASKQELQSFLDGANDLIQSITPQGNYTYVNQAWCRVLGYTAEEARSLNVLDVIDPSYHTHCKALFEQLFQTKQPISTEVLFRSKSGAPIYVEGHISSHAITNDQIITRGIFRDITQRKIAEDELKRTKKFLEQTSAVAGVGGWEVDLIQNTVFWTQTTRDIHEVDPDFVPDLVSGFIFYKEGYSRETIQKVVNQAIETGEPFDVELRIITARGNQRWVRAVGRAEFQDNTCVRLYGTFQDIDDQKKKETQRKLLESVVTHAKDAVIITEATHADPSISPIIYVNQAFCQMTGYCEEEVIGQSPLILQGPATDREGLARIQRALTEGRPIEIDLVNYKKDGEQFWSNFSVVPVSHVLDATSANSTCSQEKQTYWVTIQRDITEQKLSEENLRQAMTDAQTASVAKSEFLANMSHEIRTPLNGVIGFTDLLLKTQLDEDQAQYMQAVHHSANALLGLINDILDFSKIEAGKLELSEEKCHLWDLLAQVSNIIKHKVEEKNLELLLNIAPDLPQFVWVDPVRLRQILINLLGNAVKFTEIGEIEISVKPITPSSNGELSYLEFSVRDTGIGVKKDRQHTIFNAFDQEDASTTRKYGGTGLGLTISNQLLSLMGTKMELESEPGKGSRFFFKLRLKTETGDQQTLETQKNIQHVLIVDDHPKNCQIIHDMLASSNISSDTAENGLAALKKLEQNSYDLLILDYYMPYMNGSQVVREIRETLKINSRELPILLLHSGAEDKEVNPLIHPAGIQKVISKPITLQHLTNAITNIGSLNEPQLVQVAPSNVITQQEITILLVDDNSVNRKLAKTMLRQILPNATVTEAEDGLDAVQSFQQHLPDIVLMDIQMPKMSGYEASRKIREIDQEGQTTIIALTAGAVKGERERCLEAGMDDYLSKPFVLDTLRNKLYPWIENGELKNEPVIESSEHLPSHFDLEKCKIALDIDDETIIAELLNDFFKQLDEDLPLLHTALQNTDLNTINKIGHKHKSSSRMLNINTLGVLMRDLENLKVFDQRIIEELMQQIEQEIFQVRVSVVDMLEKYKTTDSTRIPQT
ncbi:MAG: PAS domain S-box protein [Bacteroidota bacterium]